MKEFSRRGAEAQRERKNLGRKMKNNFLVKLMFVGLVTILGLLLIQNRFCEGVEVFYIANDGNDEDTGLAGHPWQTLAKAESAKAVTDAGDVIINLNRGDRFREMFTIPALTSLTIQDYGTGALPIIDGSDEPSWSAYTDSTQTSVYSITPNASSTDHVTRNYRDITGAISANVVAVRLVVTADASNDADIDGMSIGIAAADTFSMTGAPIRVTFAGSNSVNVPAGESRTSDTIIISASAGQKLLIPFYTTDRDFSVSSGGGRLSAVNTTAGDSSQVKDVKMGRNGWAQQTVDYIINVISLAPPPANVYKSTHTVQPNWLFRNGARLATYMNPSIAALDSNYNWRWESNTLYVFSDTDPSSDGSVWKIPQRANGIYALNKSNVTVKNLKIANTNGDSSNGGGVRDVVNTGTVTGLSMNNVEVDTNYYAAVIHRTLGTGRIAGGFSHTNVRARYNHATDGLAGTFFFFGSGGEIRDFTALGNSIFETIGNYHGYNYNNVHKSDIQADTARYVRSSAWNVENGSDSLKIHHCFGDSVGIGTAGDRDVIGIGSQGHGSSDITIEDSDLRNSTNAIIEVSLTTHTPPEHQTNILIQRNIFKGGLGSGSGIKLSGDVGHTVTGAYNLFDGVTGHAGDMQDSTGTFNFYHNTVVNSQRCGFYQSEGTANVKWNIFHNDGLANSAWKEIEAAAADITLTSDYNVIYHPASATLMGIGGSGKSWAQWQTAGYDANSFNADPVFADTTLWTIGETSPGKDIIADDGLGYTSDYYGTTLPQGTGYDAGYHEFEVPVSPTARKRWGEIRNRIENRIEKELKSW